MEGGDRNCVTLVAFCCVQPLLESAKGCTSLPFVVYPNSGNDFSDGKRYTAGSN